MNKLDTEPNKIQSLPVSSQTKFTACNFVFHFMYNLKRGQIIEPRPFRPTFQRNGFRSDKRFLIMNHSNESNLKLYVASDRISIRVIVFLRLVRLGLHNGGQAGQGAERCGQSRLGGRALQLEQDRGPSAAARVGQGAEC